MNDEELCRELFKPSPRYRGKRAGMCNINSYAGKHIIERNRHIKEPCEETDFINLMEKLDIKPFHSKVGAMVYPIRLKKKYENLWKSSVRMSCETLKEKEK